MATITEKEFQVILRQTRDSFLAKMEKNGFWYLSKRHHGPFPWDINNGLCEDFAEAICKLVPEAQAVDIVTFEGTDDEDANGYLLLEYSHFWILWEGKHYDAECTKGVVKHRDLPFFNPKGNPRPNLPKAIRKHVKEYRTDGITPVSINNGYCADFATVIWEQFGRCAIQILSNEDLSGEEYTHTFMKHGGRFFDAEAPNGVDDWRDLPFFKRERRELARKNKRLAIRS